MESSSQPAAIGGSEGDDRNQEKAVEAEAASETIGGSGQLVMPEDGYEWKKYGQKFIKNIQKIRSYFRCRHKLCGAKKKVEWHPSDPSGDLRIVYKGAHHHGSPASSSSPAAAAAGASNRYELGAQYFGGGGAGARSQ